MLRWFGAVLVVLSSGLISMNEVIRSRQRIRALRVLAEALAAMRGELSERHMPLPELTEHLAARQKQPAAEFFGAVTVNLLRRELPWAVSWGGAGWIGRWRPSLRRRRGWPCSWSWRSGSI